MIFCNILCSLLCTNVYGDTGCFFCGSLNLDDLNPSIYIFATSYMIGSIELVDYLETGWICLLVFARRLNSCSLSNWWKGFSALSFTIAAVVGGRPVYKFGSK
jgi:hypothetical protein